MKRPIFSNRAAIAHSLFFTHLNSTDGDTIHALDLGRRRLVRLGPHRAIPIPIPNEPSFFSEVEERYRPLGEGKRTVNCSYLERWDSEFRKVRYSRDVPAIFGEACGWRKGSAPLTMFTVFVVANMFP